ncbi:hypothetical protein MUY27_18185 [Mucilaginibacter sp. RS28]|uniref:Uncharacterized protein n=1 Tax=Mucilaginibacter straminoryzae TaxID=2932774 RepID=A0A9X2BEQ6_9SPHI|nr:hypothetical protein [Mucilaginibacter straminoryzae]MCJ8211653.1 hypothetical protein [Mucilaginibacter straminoryzae]
MTEQQPPKQASADLKILGYNLLIFAVYTIACVAAGKDNIFVGFMVAVFHFLVCVFAAIIQKKWSWLLAGFLILVIGFGTCVNGFSISGH